MGDEQFRGSPNIQSSEPVVPASNTNTTPMAPAQESEAARRMAAMLAGGSEAAAIRPEMQNPYASVELGQDVALQSGQPYVAQAGLIGPLKPHRLPDAGGAGVRAAV